MNNLNPTPKCEHENKDKQHPKCLHCLDCGYDKCVDDFTPTTPKPEKECTPFCTNKYCSPDCVKATEKPVEICGLPVLEGANAICANSKPCERHTENPIEDTVSVVISGSYLIPKIPKRATRKVLKN